jgi:transcription elongation factor Elf1
MIYIDIKYASLLSAKLDNYKVKTNNPYLANFRCPICGDSKKSKNKSRAYFYIAFNVFRMKCHNCGFSRNFPAFLKQIDEDLYHKYCFEKFGASVQPELEEVETEPEQAPPKLLDNLFDRLDKLAPDHAAVKYCLGRKIPRNKFSEIYYIDDVSKIDQLSEKYKEKITSKEGRIVLPFYNRNGVLVGVTLRAIEDLPLKYISIKLNDDAMLIFNYEGMDVTKQVYCVEGPLDSLFLDNCVAANGSDMKKMGKILPKNTIYIFDNQPRNKEIVRLVRAHVLSGYKVCIWPEDLNEKDINEMVMNGLDPKKIISENVYWGLEAQLKFSNWNKTN